MDQACHCEPRRRMVHLAGGVAASAGPSQASRGPRLFGWIGPTSGGGGLGLGRADGLGAERPRRRRCLRAPGRGRRREANRRLPFPGPGRRGDGDRRWPASPAMASTELRRTCWGGRRTGEARKERQKEGDRTNVGEPQQRERKGEREQQANVCRGRQTNPGL